MTAAQASAVYDFEGAFEPACASVFIAEGLTCATPATITQFQSARPRIELIFRTGSAVPRGTSGQRVIVDGLGNIRDCAYEGELSVTVITNASETNKVEHSQYRAMVRALAMNLPLSINGPDGPLVNHKWNFITHKGDSWTIQNQDGNWQTSMSFDVKFSINSNAFQLLT